MNKIGIIIHREFSTRVRKKSFLIMSILGPFLFAAMALLPMWFATMEDKDLKLIAVVDNSNLFVDKIPETQTIKFKYLQGADYDSLKKVFQYNGYWGILHISSAKTFTPESVELVSYSQPPMQVRMHIQGALEKEVEHLKLASHNISNIEEILKSIKTNLDIKTVKLEEGGKSKESYTEVSMIVGYISGFLIYLFVLLFGTQVMRGVMEEKTSRIVEVIVSSVKPFELMMGKIVGIAAVGLLQFLIWVVLTFSIYSVAINSISPNIKKAAIEQTTNQNISNSGNPASLMQQASSQANSQQVTPDEKAQKMNEVMKAVKSINFISLIGWFLFFFLGGYLLYASLFASIGAAVDSETDTQQFMFPVTIPLIFAVYVMISTINNPESSLSFWCSIIPLTSPIVMMVRIPFDVPAWQLAVSATVLVLSFIGTTWLAGRIYRTGILMYGKKVSYRELWKWIKY